METENEHPLQWVSKVTELNDICEFLGDPAIDQAMDLMVKLYMKEGLPKPGQIPALIVKLQAISGTCAVKAKYYMIREKDSAKKNVYFTLRETLDKLVDSLKYLAKYGYE